MLYQIVLIALMSCSDYSASEWWEQEREQTTTILPSSQFSIDKLLHCHPLVPELENMLYNQYSNFLLLEPSQT